MTDTAALVKRAGELADADQLDEALNLCNQVLYLEPDNFKALFCAGSVLMKAGKHVHAVQLLKRVCELKPNDCRGWGQLGLCYGEFHRYDESIALTEKALGLKREAKTLSDAAYAHINGGNWDRGAELARQALALDPELSDAKLHLTNYALATQDWRTGWAGYRQTMRTKYRKEWSYGDTQEWQGEPDAVVMVTGEQGLGDEIMAASVVPDAVKACRTFILDCDERLEGIFRRSFPTAIVTGSRRSATVRLPVMPTHHKTLFGLCELFRNSNADFPRKPYLVARDDYRAMFRALCEEWGKGRPVIGLAWSGGLPRTGQDVRKVGPAAFAPLIRRGDAVYVSLEYRDDAADVAEFERSTGLSIKRLPWVAQGRDMDVLAAFLANLDEVIGIHTSALHLSSALGVPTTVITHRGSGWRYAPEQMLWYPPSTVMHKKQPGESWRDCVARLVELRKIAA